MFYGHISFAWNESNDACYKTNFEVFYVGRKVPSWNIFGPASIIILRSWSLCTIELSNVDGT